jgi:hypothetical protein
MGQQPCQFMYTYFFFPTKITLLKEGWSILVLLDKMCIDTLENIVYY